MNKMDGPVIELSRLSKSYGKARGIEDLSLEVRKGEIFGFIGPNGAGKSTTIRILLNLIFPSSGSARIMGMDVIRDTKEIKRRVGYVPSDANAYSSMEVMEFLSYCVRFYGMTYGPERIRELAEMLELDTGRKIADLSMGNRKKVSIIQSLLHSPDLLILDEPTTGLDPLMQTKFFDLLRLENERGMTVFFSSHILNEVQSLCKRVAIIREGRIVALEEIETLRMNQLKKVQILFREQVDPGTVGISGMTGMIRNSDNSFSFTYSGDLNDLTRALSGHELVNLIVEEPSLEEIFLHYYK